MAGRSESEARRRDGDLSPGEGGSGTWRSR